MDPAQERIGPVEKLPGREPADHEVAAGAVAGLVAGGAVGFAALVASEQASFFPLRLVAASFLGHEALDPISVGPVLLGAALGALSAIVLALVFTSILPRGLGALASVAAGLAFGVAAWAVTWYALVRLVDPVLFAAGRPLDALLLNLLFGAVLGLLLPPLRRVLP
jgi:hypothetical protein